MARTIVFSLGLLALSHSIAAQTERAEAREHFEKALSHLKSNELEPALAEFETAYRLHPHYAVLYDIGHVQTALGKHDAAVDAFERYLEQGGNLVPADRRAEALRVIAESATRISRLQIVTSPDGASVRVDGHDRGKTPLRRALVLPPGRHDLDLTLEGRVSAHRSVDLAGGALVQLEIPLEREPAEAAKLGSLDIECAIADVSVWVDGRAVARTPVASVMVPLGAREVVFRRPGFSSSHATVLVTAEGASARCRNKPLDPPPAASAGRIALDLPRSAVARLDGEALNAGGRVQQGHHRLEITALGYRAWEREISVERGKTLAIAPVLEPDADTLRERQIQRTWAWSLGATGAGLLTTAGVMFFWNNSRYQDWKHRQDSLDGDWAKDTPPRSTDLVARQTQNDQLLLSVRAFDRVTLGLAASGGALVAGGALLYFTGDDPNPKSRPTVIVERQGASLGWSSPW